MKVANIDIEILHKFLNDLTNFSEIFRKDVTYDNIKSCKKTGFHPLFKTYIFQKIIEGGQSNAPSFSTQAFQS